MLADIPTPLLGGIIAALIMCGIIATVMVISRDSDNDSVVMMTIDEHGRAVRVKDIKNLDYQHNRNEAFRIFRKQKDDLNFATAEEIRRDFDTQENTHVTS